MSSSTKIEIEYPYSTKYKSAYLVVNKDNRRTVILYNSHSDRSSTQYARYLMAVKLGRFLEEHDHIDHKDDDKTNDHIDNLQILTLAQNNIKTHKKPNVELSLSGYDKGEVRKYFAMFEDELKKNNIEYRLL